MQLRDNLERVVDKNSPVYITLHTFRESLKRFFVLQSLPLIQSQDVKRELRRGVDNPNESTVSKYPYSYYSLSALSLVKDQQGIKQIARNSMGFTFDDLANAVLKKAFLFPATIVVDLHYVTNDLVDALNFSARALIIAQSGKLNARVEYEGLSWIVAITQDSESIQLPRSDKDLEADPEGIDIQTTFTISTKLGAVRDVPKVNNRGTVTTDVLVRPQQ